MLVDLEHIRPPERGDGGLVRELDVCAGGQAVALGGRLVRVVEGRLLHDEQRLLDARRLARRAYRDLLVVAGHVEVYATAVLERGIEEACRSS